MVLLLLAAATLLLLLLQRILIVRFGRRGVSYHRAFAQKAAFCGDTVTFTEVLANRSALLLSWVRLEARIPAAIRFEQSADLDVRGNNYHKSVFTLMPFSQVTRKHRVHLQHRGHYQLQGTALTMGDLAGLSHDMAELDAPCEILVYPALLPSSLALPASLAQGDAIQPRWILPDPFLVSGIRAYRAGDAQRDIHWPATARMGALQVKTHEYTAESCLMVLINVQKGEDQWGELMDYEREQIENAISLAASMCMQALERGTSAGFAANMPLDQGSDFTCLWPERGSGRREELLCAYACLQVRRTCSFTTFLDRLGAMQGMDIVIISCYDSPAIRERMAAMTRMGNSTALYVMEDVHAQ